MRFLILLAALAAHAENPWWHVQNTGNDSNLRGVSVTLVHSGTGKFHYVWASGSNGAILRSADSGGTWQQLAAPDGAALDFRDIEAFGHDTAYVMSSGDGDKSRIYKTTDGGKTWTLQYSDNRPGFFLDALACDSAIHCFALSDPVEGKFLVLATDDGEHWKELPRDKMPLPLPGEGAFAASGSAIVLCGKKNIYFGTGGGHAARIFRSGDRGRSWMAAETPIAAGNASSGIFSIACEGSLIVAVGGDYKDPAGTARAAAYSNDAGATWRLANRQPGGYRSGIALLGKGQFVTVGINGTDVSDTRKGVAWRHVDSFNFNAVKFVGMDGWAVGPKGNVARFDNRFGTPSSAAVPPFSPAHESAKLPARPALPPE